MPTRRPRNSEDFPEESPGLYAGSWVELVEVGPDDVVVLLDGAAGRAVEGLRERAGRLHVQHDGGASSLPASIDLVCVDGLSLTPTERRGIAARLSTRARWVQVSDNGVSLLRLVDRARGRPSGADAHPTTRRLARRVAHDTGLELQQSFALLRSSARPVTAFDSRARSGLRHVADASLTHVAGLRGAVLRAVRRLPPGLVGAQAPAWLLVLVMAGAELDPDRIIGKVGNRDSEQVKLLRGDPPAEIEKRFPTGRPDSEVEALRELAQRGFTLAPRLVAAGPTTLRYVWQPGHTLPVSALSVEELETWLQRAAAVLGELQAATRDPDGTVRVHGDFWLGNLLVTGTAISGVLDWDTSHRGSPGDDAEFLVDSLAGHPRATPALLARWHQVVSAALA